MDYLRHGEESLEVIKKAHEIGSEFRILKCLLPIFYVVGARVNAHVPRFSYHFTFAVEAPMATTPAWPSPLRSATTTPDAAI